MLLKTYTYIHANEAFLKYQLVEGKIKIESSTIIGIKDHIDPDYLYVSTKDSIFGSNIFTIKKEDFDKLNTMEIK